MSDEPRVSPEITGVRRTSSGWQARIGLYTDEAGYFGRQCPDPQCRTFYKLSAAEYEAAPDDLRLTCPVCGLVAHHRDFITPEQKERGEAGALEFARAAADQVIREFSRNAAMRSRPSSGVRIEWTAHKNPPRTPQRLPSYVERATLRTFECPNDGHHAVIYDLLAFCPWCGPETTPPRAVFDDNVAAQQRLLSLLEELSPEARESIEASGGATALAERALTGLVAASQNMAKQLHAKAGKEPAKGNPWQNVERLRRQWLTDFERDPLEVLEPPTVQILRMAFSRRHVLEHNGGVVDEAYVRATGEGTVGRRLRIRPAFVKEAVMAAVALANELESSLRP